VVVEPVLPEDTLACIALLLAEIDGVLDCEATCEMCWNGL
jgi:hypothetical protein